MKLDSSPQTGWKKSFIGALKGFLASENPHKFARGQLWSSTLAADAADNDSGRANGSPLNGDSLWVGFHLAELLSMVSVGIQLMNKNGDVFSICFGHAIHRFDIVG